MLRTTTANSALMELELIEPILFFEHAADGFGGFVCDAVEGGVEPLDFVFADSRPKLKAELKMHRDAGVRVGRE